MALNAMILMGIRAARTICLALFGIMFGPIYLGVWCCCGGRPGVTQNPVTLNDNLNKITLGGL